MVSCAQQTILTGGAKDNKPPKLVLDSNRIITNFSENHLLLEFNENIQLIKDKRTFITNPKINNIELIEEKNKINLVWRDSLSKNTTYSFIFINAIADITESNILSLGDFFKLLFIKKINFSNEDNHSIIKEEINLDERF